MCLAGRAGNTYSIYIQQLVQLYALYTCIYLRLRAWPGGGFRILMCDVYLAAYASRGLGGDRAEPVVCLIAEQGRPIVFHGTNQVLGAEGWLS